MFHIWVYPFECFEFRGEFTYNMRKIWDNKLCYIGRNTSRNSDNQHKEKYLFKGAVYSILEQIPPIPKSSPSSSSSSEKYTIPGYAQSISDIEIYPKSEKDIECYPSSDSKVYHYSSKYQKYYPEKKYATKVGNILKVGSESMPPDLNILPE